VSDLTTLLLFGGAYVVVFVIGKKLGAWIDRQEARERARALDWRSRRERRRVRHTPRLLIRIPDVEHERWRLN
jgi:hypothetical protein